MIHTIAPERGTDPAGAGHFGAPRGTRLHMGIDLAVAPGSKVLSPTYGVLSKFGRCYRDTPEYRYVEITSQNGFRYRLFYVSPGMQQIGDTVAEGEDIGTAQDISARYPVPKGMKPHIHFEIKDRNGNYVNPKELVL